MIKMQMIRTTAAILVAGLVFYYVDTYFVGFAAAIAFPSWYAEFVVNNPRTGFALWDMVTIVPITVATSVAVGALLAKAINRRFFISGLAAVLVAIVFASFVTQTDQSWLVNLRNHAFPTFSLQIPMFFALWLSLPIAVHFFGNRKLASK